MLSPQDKNQKDYLERLLHVFKSCSNQVLDKGTRELLERDAQRVTAEWIELNRKEEQSL